MAPLLSRRAEREDTARDAGFDVRRRGDVLEAPPQTTWSLLCSSRIRCGDSARGGVQPHQYRRAALVAGVSCFSILAGLGAWWMWMSSVTSRWILAGLLLWMLGSSALIHPDYLAYFNELGGDEPSRV